MENDDFRLKLEELGIESDKIDEIFVSMGDSAGAILGGRQATGVSELDLKERLAGESDWRKRATLAAKIISLNLE